jgi:hypothetical protein
VSHSTLGEHRVEPRLLERVVRVLVDEGFAIGTAEFVDVLPRF